MALTFTAAGAAASLALPALLGGIALNALLVAIVYRALIAGTLVQTGQEKLADLFLHGITPVLVLLFWLACVPRGRVAPPGRPALGGDAAPLLRLCAGAGRRDGIYPYPFLDVAAIGWAAVLRNAAVIAFGFLVAGFGLVWVDRWRGRRDPPA